MPLVACTSLQRVLPRQNAPAGNAQERRFAPGQLVKTDVDRFADTCRQEVFASLRVMAEKLYRRNPAEMRKSGITDVKTAVAYAMDPAHAWRYSELDGQYGTDAIQLAFREDFHGDRVLALVAGLGGMMHIAFDEKNEFYLMDDLDPQKLYNSARNVEIAVWRLSNTRMSDGHLFLLTNESAQVGQPANLSFEREFGKMIGQLDLLALGLADKFNRTLVKVAQSLATAVFLPVVMVK